MLHAPPKKTKQKRGRVKYTKHVGIVSDARKLGVNRSTLWRVLEGQWNSKSLMRRYRSLKKEAA